MSIFDSILLKRPGRTTFDRSFNNKLTFNIGELVPTLSMDVVGGDRVKLSQSYFMRMQPLFAPIMHKVNVKNYFFFVPNRILSDKWEDFITGGKDNEIQENIEILPNFDSIDGDDGHSFNLLDFLGIVTPGMKSVLLNGNTLYFDTPLLGLSFLAYWRVIFDYFVDETIDSDLYAVLDRLFDGYQFKNGDSFDKIQSALISVEQDDPMYFYDCFNKRYRKDYFTSALLTPQRGNAVQIPFDPTITGDNNPLGTVFVDELNGTQTGNVSINSDGKITVGGVERALIGDVRSSGAVTTLNDIVERLTFGSNLIDVEALRTAIVLQEYAERSNVAGYRYFEWLQAHFGIKSSDARLQRAEFLGSVSQPVSFAEVEQNSQGTSEDDTPLGNLAGKAVSGDANYIFDFEAPEHGWIIGLTVVEPKASYFQGIHRKLLRQNPFDWLMPSFAHLGEQPIYRDEIFAAATEGDDEYDFTQNIFGYQSRYAEYKWSPDEIHGEFASSKLDFWHAARMFSNAPNLNSEFLEIKATDFDRIFAVSAEKGNQVLLDMDFKIDYTTSLPKYGTPRLL